MSKYKKTEIDNKLDAIQSKYGEPYFRMGVSHLIDVGFRAMLDDDSVNFTVEKLKTTPDEPDSMLSNEFLIHIMEIAKAIAEACTPVTLLTYSSHCMTWGC